MNDTLTLADCLAASNATQKIREALEWSDAIVRPTMTRAEAEALVRWVEAKQ